MHQAFKKKQLPRVRTLETSQLQESAKALLCQRRKRPAEPPFLAYSTLPARKCSAYNSSSFNDPSRYWPIVVSPQCPWRHFGSVANRIYIGLASYPPKSNATVEYS